MADPSETRVRSFVMTLEPSGRGSTIKLDGADIGGLLRGVEVTTAIDQPTIVTLYCSKGHRVELTALVPEAQVIIREGEPEPEEPG